MIEDLSPDDLVSLYIGRAAREAVELALALQRAFKELAGQPYDVPGTDEINTLIDGCLEALASSAFPEALRATAKDALEFARKSNRRRNRLVHDLWRPSDDDPSMYVATKFDIGDKTPLIVSLTVDEFRRSVIDLKVAQNRVVAIYWWLIAGELPTESASRMRLMNEQFMAGRFTVDDASGHAVIH